jgi:hypothetical protein
MGGMKRRLGVGCVCAVLACSIRVPTVLAQQLNPQQIQLIEGTAASICNTVKDAKGQKSDLALQGDVKAELGGLVGKVVNLGGSGKGSLTREEFEGLSREATAAALEGDRGCRERVFNRMFDRLSAAEGYVAPNQPEGDSLNRSYIAGGPYGSGIYMAPEARDLNIGGNVVICGSRYGIEQHGTDVNINGNSHIYSAKKCGPPPEYMPTGVLSSLPADMLKIRANDVSDELLAIKAEEEQLFINDTRDDPALDASQNFKEGEVKLDRDNAKMTKRLAFILYDTQEVYAEIIKRFHQRGVAIPEPTGPAKALLVNGIWAGNGVEDAASYLNEVSSRL